MFFGLLQLENETPSFTKTLLRLRAGSRRYEKYDSCNNLVLMRMALRLLNVCTQSPAAVLAPSSLLISPPLRLPQNVLLYPTSPSSIPPTMPCGLRLGAGV